MGPVVGGSLGLFSHHFDPIRLIFSRTFLQVSCQPMLFSHCLALVHPFVFLFIVSNFGGFWGQRNE